MNKTDERDNMQSQLKDRAISPPAETMLLVSHSLRSRVNGRHLRLPASNSQPSHHVYEFRMYHVKEGKMDALKARFGDHTDTLFKQHNIKASVIGSPKMRQIHKICLSTFSSI